MRHQHKGFKLGRTSSHRKATLSALSTALIRHKRIETTITKAKALRMFVEPIINRAKADTTHNRREVFRALQDKHAVTELFTDIAGRISDRPGGYTRIIKLGQRAGDSAEMAVIELVDYNDVRPDGAAGGSKKKTRRGGSGGGRRRKGGDAQAAAPAAVADADVTEAPEAVAEEPEVAEADVIEAEVVAEEPKAAEAEAEPEAEAAAEEPEAEAAVEEPEADESTDEEKKG
ncbi:MAG: 50S ribosomal protein L17 [Rhodothermales bacterium]